MRFDASTADVTIANHTAAAVTGRVEMRVYNLDGTLSSRTSADVGGVAKASHRVVANLASALAAAKSDVCIVALALPDASGNALAENVYWRQRDGATTHTRRSTRCRVRPYSTHRRPRPTT